MVRAQFTMEFMLLFTFVFFTFLVILSVVTHMAETGIDGLEVRKLENIAESIRKTVELAHESGTGFQATISVPDNIEGVPIIVQVDDAVDIVYVENTMTGHTVTKSLADFTGTLGSPCSTVRKQGGLVEIVPSC
jgi:hypothetical protein